MLGVPTCQHGSEQYFFQVGLSLSSNFKMLLSVKIGFSLIIATLLLLIQCFHLHFLEPIPCTPTPGEFACQCHQGCQIALCNRLLQSSLNSYFQAMTSTTIPIPKLVVFPPVDTLLPQSLVNTGLSNGSLSVNFRSLSNLASSKHWGVLPSEILGYTLNSRRKSMSFSEMFTVVWSSRKLIITKMCVFRCQSHVIQYILIIMKLSPIGLIQKSVTKGMSISLATSSISLDFFLQFLTLTFH